MKLFLKESRLFSIKSAVFLSLFAIVLLVPAIAFTQTDLKLDVKQEKEIVKTVEGEKVSQRIPVEKVNVGDIIVYTITFTNAGEADALEPSIIAPVPDGFPPDTVMTVLIPI